MKLPIAVLALSACGAIAAGSAHAATDQDRGFVAQVGKGGMFEVEAGKLAQDKATTADVRDSRSWRCTTTWA